MWYLHFQKNGRSNLVSRDKRENSNASRCNTICSFKIGQRTVVILHFHNQDAEMSENCELQGTALPELQTYCDSNTAVCSVCNGDTLFFGMALRK